MASPLERFGASRVRRDFIDFFVQRGHREVRSAPVFPKDDPTLLFTNAGMNQFKDVFLGSGTRPYRRAVDTQKCIRVSGKHNDLEEVGRDTYHHTFFEMLGNWSFGDYFKGDAIRWAWELLTGVWGLPEDRLWVTVFAGDEADGLGADEEAERIWLEETSVTPSHVLRFGREDNFWEMGETGPCGPCSEIHIDRGGPDSGAGADPERGVNAGNERFIELWNLVFMQFNRLDGGRLTDLPARSVDTGMGFERILAVLQGKRSNYDTDLFTPIFERVTGLTGRAYGAGGESDVALRVCADHVRAVTAALADGALPSNDGRGYVLRRLIRRAARFGRQVLDAREPFLHEIVPAVAETLGGAFPEMLERVEHIQLVLRSEEESFARTLDRGLVRFGRLAAEVERSGARVLPGKEAFELYATDGFPRDLVDLMARERGLEVDAEGWAEAEEAHREVSRSEGRFRQLLSAEELSGLPATESTYHHEGSEAADVQARLLAVFQGPGGRARAVLSRSPFYAESGGQVGDTGRVLLEDGRVLLRVEDTQRIGDVVVHIGELQAPPPTLPCAVRAVVDDDDRRRLTRKNHTATHLLHRALKIVLGEHVAQQGSYVGPDRLRFDFSHPRAVTAEEIERVETLVNEQVAANHPVVTTVEELESAKARGVVAMFGEKYADRVRVLDVGGWSTELCGGTHVRATGSIGLFVVASERAISAGVRRLEALTGPAAVEWVQAERRILSAISAALRTRPEELPARVEALQASVKEAKKQQRTSVGADVGAAFGTLRAELAERGGVASAVLDLPMLDGAALRELGERAKTLGPPASAGLAVVLFGREDGKVPFLVHCLGEARERGLAAGALAKEIAGVLGGGGGGRPDTAQGQGARGDALGAARALALERLEHALGGIDTPARGR